MPNPFGNVGELTRTDGGPDEMPEWLKALPEWLRNQYTYYRNDESGDGRWTIGTGNIRDREGREVYQVGDESHWRRTSGANSDGGVIDPSKIRYDEDLGYVTDPENIHQEEYNWWKEGFPMLAAVVGAGTFGPALGLGEGVGAFEGAVAGAEGAFGELPLLPTPEPLPMMLEPELSGITSTLAPDPVAAVADGSGIFPGSDPFDMPLPDDRMALLPEPEPLQMMLEPEVSGITESMTGGTSWWDRLTDPKFLRAGLMTANSLFGGGDRTGGGLGRGSGGGGIGEGLGGGPGGSRARHPLDPTEMNPYAKQKVSHALPLIEYIRGRQP